jgi:hypothetical protein
MILVPGRFIYLGTPATGSSSVARVLVEQCDGVSLSATHHAHKSDMPLLDEHPEPAYTFIRDPFDYIFSRYNYKYKTEARRREHSIESFVTWYARFHHGAKSAQLPYGMCRYRDYADRFFRFEDGLEAFFKEVGLPDVDVLTVGMESGKRLGKRWTYDTVSQECRDLVEKHFADELALYRSV